MAQRFSGEFKTNWARTRVFDYLADFRNLPEWHPAVSAARLETLDWSVRNARFSARATFAGRKVGAEIVTRELERPDLIVATADNVGAQTTDRFELRELEGGLVSVTYSSVLRLKAPLRVIGPLMVPALRSSWETAIERLGERVGGERVGSGSGPTSG